ncbi:MAG: dihydropteroate synthase, partial [Myxococcales bacterium]|nr:dihydropteroate synthase [Myxococcales bacterium]
GIGFAKTPAQSAALLAATPAFVETGQRVLVGPSRKSFIAELAPDADGAKPIAGDRLGGTAAAVTAAVLFGAHALRVHDVAMMRQAARLAEACLGAGAGAERFGGLS